MFLLILGLINLGLKQEVMECGDKIMHGFIAQEGKGCIDNHSEIKMVSVCGLTQIILITDNELPQEN